MRRIWATIFLLIVVIAGYGWWYVFERKVEPVTLTVAAGARNSDSHALMREISEVLERHSDSVRLKVETSATSSESISRINRQKIDLATIESNTPAYTNIKLVADLFSDYFLLITRAETPEQTFPTFTNVPQISGLRVAIPESGTAANRSFWTVIDHYKVAPESMRTLALPHDKARTAFLKGDVNAIFLVSSLRDPFLLSFVDEAGLRHIDLKFIPIDQAEAMRLKRPYLEPVRMVKGAFDGKLPLPNKDIVVPSLQRLLVAGAHVDEGAINELVTVVFENRLDLLIRMPLSSAIKDPRRDGAAGLGLHPGAERFFDRDRPSFLQENAEPMALVVTIFAMLFSAFLALRRSISARAKNRADVYNDFLLDVAARARACDDIGTLRSMRNELGEILEKAVRALDLNEVTEDGFRSFSMLWGSVRETVNDRILELS